MEESKGPKAKFSAGAVHVAIWENTGKEGMQYNTISIEKHYKSGEEWKTTKSLRTNELPKAILALQKAYEYLALRGQEA
ncbi:MAG: hypothetical protein HY544_04680 [Candidatus Diapherotrites archaeon]|uniref:Uncharacterized protein n=1 Tax=Candidatus Iainarchaeum sp. TaxID=3101447 RepID=A0A8T3YKL5_9ARCH|nr:hypothetical protein [Candidatus Diapherotrites archaeon]